MVFTQFMNEKAPPDKEIEKWIKDNKKKFIEEYGEEKGKNILYATAWDMYNQKQKNESTIGANDILYAFLDKKNNIMDVTRVQTPLSVEFEDYLMDNPKKAKKFLKSMKDSNRYEYIIRNLKNRTNGNTKIKKFLKEI